MAAAADARPRGDRRAQRGGGGRGRAALRLRQARDRLARRSSDDPRHRRCSTTRARTTSTPSRRSPPPRRASTSSARSRWGATPTRATRPGSACRPPASSTCAPSTTASCPRCAWPAQLIEAGEHRRDPPLPRRLPAGLGHDDRGGLALRQGRRRLGRARRPRRARHRPRPLPGRRDRHGVGARGAPSSPGARGRRRLRGGGRLRGRRGGDDRGDALRHGAQERLHAGRSTAARARSPSTSSASTSCRSTCRHRAGRLGPGLPHRCSSARPSTRSGSTGGRRATSSAGSTPSCTSCITC